MGFLILGLQSLFIRMTQVASVIRYHIPIAEIDPRSGKWPKWPIGVLFAVETLRERSLSLLLLNWDDVTGSLWHLLHSGVNQAQKVANRFLGALCRWFWSWCHGSCCTAFKFASYPEFLMGVVFFAFPGLSWVLLFKPQRVIMQLTISGQQLDNFKGTLNFKHPCSYKSLHDIFLL